MEEIGAGLLLIENRMSILIVGFSEFLFSYKIVNLFAFYHHLYYNIII